MHAGGCARNRRQETNVLIVSVLFAVVVNLALRSKAQGSIEVVGMCKLTIMVGLGAFPVTIMGDPEIEDEVPRPSRVLEVADNLDVACPVGLWRVRFPPFLVRPGRRLPVQGLSEGSLPCSLASRRQVWCLLSAAIRLLGRGVTRGVSFRAGSVHLKPRFARVQERVQERLHPLSTTPS